MPRSEQSPRRRFLRLFATIPGIAAGTGLASAQDLTVGELTSLGALRRAWVRDALISRQFGEPPILSQFNDEIYYLRAPLQWSPTDAGSALPSVTVPTGFVTDLASIPRAFWQLLPRDGRYMPAAIVHDYLYWQQQVSKDAADDVFKSAMQDLNVRSATVALIHAGVRSPFGDMAWQANARLKAAGEQRILKVFPRTPAITWSQWKLTDTHFDTTEGALAK
jgi:hypothetical protein